jgi:oligoendopeptidase F
MDIRWNLEQIYDGFSDPRLTEHQTKAAQVADDVATRFRGRIATSSAPEILGLLHALEDVRYYAYRPVWYASRAFDTNTADADAKALLDRTRLEATRVSERVTFAHLELAAVSQEVLEAWLAHEPLREYRHSLEARLRTQPHTLSEPEERLAARKALSGRSAWTQLYTEISSSIRIPLEVDGVPRELTVDEVRALRTRPERDLRERATAAMYAAYEERAHVLTYVFNTLYQDWMLEVETRNYPHVLDPTALQDEIPRESIEALFNATQAHAGLLQGFFKQKARVLGLSDFSSFDILAPLSSDTKPYPYAEAQALVLEAFARFDPQVVRIAQDFFDRARVDVTPRPGKRGGAYCSSFDPREPAFLLLNHNDRLDDVFTLAHELGHGLHAELSRVQRPSNAGHSTPLAETASIFCEMLLADHLLERADDATRVNLLQDLLEKAATTLYRQVQITRWELLAHAERAKGVVTPERYSDLWLETFAQTYGEAVRVTRGDRWGWIVIPHVVNYRFYCYSYAYGMLIVLALFNRYKQEGAAFVPKYLHFLSSGNSDTPQALMSALGVDLNDPAFWNGGFAVIQGWLEQFKALTATPEPA